MRVLVCGGRDFTDRDAVWRKLDLYDMMSAEPMVLMHGGATGADSHAMAWAWPKFDVECKVFKADWSRGLRGGPERNQRMLDQGKPDVVLAFRGGRGTADMVRRARAAGVEVVEVP